MTDVERDAIADKLLALLFSLRPDDSEAGHAWVLGMLTGATARAILASIGPQGDPTPLVDIYQRRVVKTVDDAQLQFQGQLLTGPTRVPRKPS